MEQALYTSCPPRRGYRGQGGFDLLLWTPGFPVGIMDRLGRHIAGGSPTTTRHSQHWEPGVGWVLLAVSPAGEDPTTGRPGNLAAHLIILDQMDATIPPSALAAWDGWITIPDYTATRLPDLPPLPLRNLAEEMAVQQARLVAESDHRSATLRCLVSLIVGQGIQVSVSGRPAHRDGVILALHSMLPQGLWSWIEWSDGTGQTRLQLTDRPEAPSAASTPTNPWFRWIARCAAGDEAWTWNPRAWPEGIQGPSDLDAIALVMAEAYQRTIPLAEFQAAVTRVMTWGLLLTIPGSAARLAPVLTRLDTARLGMAAQAVGVVLSDTDRRMAWLSDALRACGAQAAPVQAMDSFLDVVLPALQQGVADDARVSAPQLACMVLMLHGRELEGTARGTLLNRLSSVLLEQVLNRLQGDAVEFFAIPLPHPATADLAVAGRVVWANLMTCGSLLRDVLGGTEAGGTKMTTLLGAVNRCIELNAGPIFRQRLATLVYAFRIQEVTGGDHLAFLRGVQEFKAKGPFGDGYKLGFKPLEVRSMLAGIGRLYPVDVSEVQAPNLTALCHSLVSMTWDEEAPDVLENLPLIARAHEVGDKAITPEVLVRLLQRYPEQEERVLKPFLVGTKPEYVRSSAKSIAIAITRHAPHPSPLFAQSVNVIDRHAMDALRKSPDGASATVFWKKEMAKLFQCFRREDTWWPSDGESTRLREIWEMLPINCKMNKKLRDVWIMQGIGSRIATVLVVAVLLISISVLVLIKVRDQNAAGARPTDTSATASPGPARR